ARSTGCCEGCSGWTPRWRSTATAPPSSAASWTGSAWTASTRCGSSPPTCPAAPRSPTRPRGCAGCSADPTRDDMALDPAVAATRLVVRRALADVEAGQTVLVACSGGADSLALLAATVFEAHKPSGGARRVGG